MRAGLWHFKFYLARLAVCACASFRALRGHVVHEIARVSQVRWTRALVAGGVIVAHKVVPVPYRTVGYDQPRLLAVLVYYFLELFYFGLTLELIFLRIEQIFTILAVIFLRIYTTSRAAIVEYRLINYAQPSCSLFLVRL